MTKQEFYNNIDWQAPLCRDFFMKLYGYGLYDKEFLADVLSGFQSRGRGHVRHVYDIFVELEETDRKRSCGRYRRTWHGRSMQIMKRR